MVVFEAFATNTLVRFWLMESVLAVLLLITVNEYAAAAVGVLHNVYGAVIVQVDTEISRQSQTDRRTHLHRRFIHPATGRRCYSPDKVNESIPASPYARSSNHPRVFVVRHHAAVQMVVPIASWLAL